MQSVKPSAFESEIHPSHKPCGLYFVYFALRGEGRFCKKGLVEMARHSFVRMQKLPDVAGKIDYITSPDRQEYLYSVYRTCDDGF